MPCSNNMTAFVEWLYTWQELVGAFVGSSLGIIFAGIGFLIARWIYRIDERREALRKIEISNTYSLHTTIEMQEKLSFFAKRAHTFMKELRSITSPVEIVFSTINFPPLGAIHLDPSCHTSRIKSYYLHNKLLIMHAGTTNVNLILAQFKEDFAHIIRMNETLIDITSNKPNPPAQRAAYADNTEAFAAEIERFSGELKNSIEVMVQIRVYNNHLRKNFFRGLLWRWKNEGMFSAKSIELVDKIDTAIAGEVTKNQEAAMQRLARKKAEQNNPLIR